VETIRIGNYDVDKDDAWIYIQHFGRDKTILFSWEKMRKQLHDYIFEKLELERVSDEGIEFSRAFDKWAEPHILKYDPISARAKGLSNAKDNDEIKKEQYLLEMEMRKDEYRIRNGGRNFSAKDTNNCRICKKDLPEGTPRQNDHLMCPAGFEEVNSPICLDCSKDKPDEYHKAFRKHFGI